MVTLAKKNTLATRRAALAYITRVADGTETEHAQPLADLQAAMTPAQNGGWLLTLAETEPIVGDTLHLQG